MPLPPPALAEVYDELTLAALERRSVVGGAAACTAVPKVTVAGWRRRTTAGAVASALALGVQEALEPEDADEVVVEVDLDGRPDPTAAVHVWLVPGAPAASVAVVRYWLLRGSFSFPRQ